MRAPTSSPGLSVAMIVALGGLGACAFRPEGGPQLDDDDGSVAPDAAGIDGGRDAAVAVDARSIDAGPSFDLSTCPSGYVAVADHSRYRTIDPTTWAMAQARCKAHSNGLITHLVVLGGDGERDAVGWALLLNGDLRRTWIGTFHDGTEPRTVTGEPLYPLTDLRAGQAVSWVRSVVSPFRGDPGSTVFAALCECDGRASQP